MTNKCPICKKVTTNCKCDDLVCVCGHTLGYHRMVKYGKAQACLEIVETFKENGKHDVGCKCNQFQLKVEGVEKPRYKPVIMSPKREED